MSKVEKYKELIGYLKVIFSILIAIDVSIIAWLFKYNDTVSDVKIILAFIAVFLITLAIIVINKKILHKIDELEGL
jgi:4-hydroxybenzoate polyprenyltransferase